MRTRFSTLGLLLIALFYTPGLRAQTWEEFNGPFRSWADVKQRFGARGDGHTDDTRAIQTAIDSLSCPPTGYNNGSRGYMVVYLPAGTYCISSTLLLKGKIGVGIVGEDPRRTVIKWIGKDNDTLLWANGSAYYRVGRITWDANGRQGMEGIGIHWKEIWNHPGNKSFAALNIELSDNIFTGGFKYGISGGTGGGSDGTGLNDSEITIKRCSFFKCSSAGIWIHGYNALDYWIWDCRFFQCYDAIHCYAGNYHAYRCFMSGSGERDLFNEMCYYISARGCYSENAPNFSGDRGISANPFKRTFQDNTVTGLKSSAIIYYHLGKVSLWGNKFSRSKDTAVKTSMEIASWAPGIYEALSLHNTYAYAQPIKIKNRPDTIYTYGDKRGDVQASPAAFLKTQDSTPAEIRRPVLDVPPGADGRAIQAILDLAASLKGKRPVVHFPAGAYSIDRPLVIPAGSDMKLQGDGLLYASVILAKKPVPLSQDALIRIEGPSQVTIVDLQLGREDDPMPFPAIVCIHTDQPGAQAHLDQLYSHADTTLAVRRMNYLYVEKDNSFFSDGNFVEGGSLLQHGQGTARVACFGGQFARVAVAAHGDFLAKDCWWEGGLRTPLDLRGSGNICIDGAMIAPNGADSLPTVKIGRFDGNISLMNMYLQGALMVNDDNPGLQLLVWNVHFLHKMNVLDFIGKKASYKGAFLGLNAQCFRPADPACKDILSIPDRLVNEPSATAVLEDMTQEDRRTSPALLKELPAGTSNIYVSRVSFGRGGTAISFQ
jgi:hypothetical protein